MIRGAIMDGTFPAGSRLKERELCELTEVSRTSVREAVRILEAQGLVITVPGEGPRVATLSEEEAQELYAVRGILESYAAREFTLHASNDDVELLRATVDALAKANADNDGAAAGKLVDQLYDLLLTRSGNRFLKELLEPLHARISMLRSVSLRDAGRSAAAVGEFDALADAVVARDVEEAERLSREHVFNAGQSALSILRRSASQAPAAR